MTESDTDKPNTLVVQDSFRLPAEKRKFRAIIYAMAVVVALAPMAIAYALVMRNPWIAPGGMELDVQERGQTLFIRDVKRWQGETWFLIHVSNDVDNRCGLFTRRGDEFKLEADLGEATGDKLLPDTNCIWIVSTKGLHRYRDGRFESEKIPSPKLEYFAGYAIHQQELVAVSSAYDGIVSSDGKLKAGHLAIRMHKWDGTQWIDRGRIAVSPIVDEQFRGIFKFMVPHMAKDQTLNDVIKFMRNYICEEFSNRLFVTSVGDKLTLLWPLSSKLDPEEKTPDSWELFYYDSILLHTGWSSEIAERRKNKKSKTSESNRRNDDSEVTGDSYKSDTDGDRSVPQNRVTNWITIKNDNDQLRERFRVFSDGINVVFGGEAVDEEEPTIICSRIDVGKFEQLFEIPMDPYYVGIYMVKGETGAVYRFFFDGDQKLGGEQRAPWYVEFNRGIISNEKEIGFSFSELYYPVTWSYWKLRILIFGITVGLLAIFALLPIRLTRALREGSYVAVNLIAKPATLWQRCVAKGIDTLLFLIPFVMLGYFIWNDLFSDDYTISKNIELIMLDLNAFGWYADLEQFRVIIFLCPVVVCPIFLALILSLSEAFSGKTPGKWLLGIEVRDVNLGRTSFRPVLLRRLLMAVDGYAIYFLFAPVMFITLRNSMFYSTFAGAFVVGMVLIAVSEKQQRVGDMVAKTVVIQSGSIVSNSIVSTDVETVAEPD